jgi:2-keto-4-pentenoate hydratase/2-oxohepta-3-ene-1,7-dioic acid hydratase in catechol pathway
MVCGMRFASWQNFADGRWGAVDGRQLVDLGSLAPSLREALERNCLPRSAAALPNDAPRVPLDEVRLLPPIPDAARIFCVGLNYVEHREETGRKPTAQPVIFMRSAPSITGHGTSLIAPPESDSFDFEGELAVFIGRAGRRITPANAMGHVGGYACFMDGSIREFQSHTSQFTPGKNFDRSGACGPLFVTPDECGDPARGWRLLTRLNGNVVQQAKTDEMIFPIPELIAYLSTFTRLAPGDVIATGTPGGVGFKRNPPLFMQPGDRVEVEIDKVGLLANPIVAEHAP